MVNRKEWQTRIEEYWQDRSVVWLMGVRRTGKTFLSQSLPDILYFDCEEPPVRAKMEDPEDFLDGLKGKRVVLDEVHRLGNPSQLLKIAADHYPTVRILATGSSGLGASVKFRDTLTGRKYNLWLTPMTLSDMQDFGQTDLKHRLLRGGLPPFFLAERFKELDFQEWMDAYWAQDIQNLFRLERRDSFARLFELLMMQSGGLFEALSLAGPCGASRQTIMNYLRILEDTFVVHVIKPYFSNRSKEIIAMPKVYAFDTGFVAYYHGWDSLRAQDLGALWEHFVLNEMHAHTQMRRIQYWRDKQKHEVDFIWKGRGRPPLAIECKWSASEFDDTNLQAFRRQHPEGENVVVAHDVDRAHTRTYKNLTVHFDSLPGLLGRLEGV